MAFRSRGFDLAFVLGLAAIIGLRLLVIGAAARSCPEAMAAPDTPSYELPAQALVEIGRFLEAPIPSARPETVRTPGYPAFLALHRVCGGVSRVFPSISQVLIHALGLAVVLHALRGVGRRREAVIGLWLAAFDPVSLGNGARIGSDLLFVGLLLCLTPAIARTFFSDDEIPHRAIDPATPLRGPRALISFFRRRGWPIEPLAIGLALGGLALVRPIAYFLPFAFVATAIARWARSRARGRPSLLRGRAWLLLFTGWAVVCAGWQLRNHVVADTWELSTVTGRNLYRYRAARVVSLRDGISYAAARESLMAALPGVDSLPNAEKSRVFRHAALPILRENPELVARVSLEGVGRMFLVPGESTLLEVLCLHPPTQGALGDLLRLRPREYLAKWLGEHRFVFLTFGIALVHLGILLAGSFLGALVLWRERRWSPVHVVLAVELLYFAILSAGPEADPRFRLPVIPVLAVFAASGIAFLSVRIRRDSGEA